VALVGVTLFLVSFSFASAYTLRARILPVGFSAGGSHSNGGASAGNPIGNSTSSNGAGGGNGGVNSGDGGNGGNAGTGGLVRAGSVVSNATAVNALNTTIVRIGR